MYNPFFLVTHSRGIAPIGRAPDSKSGCWEFESLYPCHIQNDLCLTKHGSFLHLADRFMNKEMQKQSESNTLDTAKLILAIAILIGSLVGYYVFQEVHAVLRVLGVVVGIGLALFVLYLTNVGRSWYSYLSHAKREVKQVVWPTRPETVQMTLIVFVVVILMGIFLWLVDMFFMWAVKLLTGQGG